MRRSLSRSRCACNAIKQLGTGEAVVLAAVGERRVATIRVASEPPRRATP
ncbi:MAG TPA: hypothetical protein VF221_19470 [Chloroflexota bacterium]